LCERKTGRAAASDELGEFELAYFHSIEFGCTLRLYGACWQSFKSELLGSLHNERLATPQFRPYP
jgi:hypothetical protein